ncbi:MAG TPA: DUF3232 domain-containing protein [Candidatus Paceibacterota bacterium]
MSIENPWKKEASETPHQSIEKTLAKLHAIKQMAHYGHAMERDEIERVIRASEGGTAFDKHENGEALTIEHIVSSSAHVSRIVEAELQKNMTPEERKALEAHRNLLVGRAAAIMDSARRYASSVEQFAHIVKNQKHMQQEEFKDKLVAVDRARRANHEVLIESLKVYNDTVKWFIEEGYIDESEVQEWNPGLQVPTPNDLLEKPSRAIYIFPQSFLVNRDMIKEWGIAEVFRESVNYIEAEEALARGELPKRGGKTL